MSGVARSTHGVSCHRALSIRPSRGSTHRVTSSSSNRRGRNTMTLYVGDDWAEAHHDVHLMNRGGRADRREAAARRRRGCQPRCTHSSRNTPLGAGRRRPRHRDRPRALGLGPGCGRLPRLRDQPALCAARYRERHHVGGAKSDAGDAKVLADLVRTDRHNHREVAGDSDEAAAVRILARAHQQFIWDRTRQTSRLRRAPGGSLAPSGGPSRARPG